MTVLVVDDEKMLRDAILFEFEMDGVTAHGAGNGKEALDILKTEPIDVVVSDVRMPQMTGIGLLEEVRKTDHQKPPMIFLTGYADITLEQAYAMGIDCILPKPFDPISLREAVDRLRISRVKYWSDSSHKQTSDSVEVQVDRINFGENVGEYAVHIGRGGAFVPWQGGHQEVDKRLHVNIRCDDSTFPLLNFTGTVRWTRITSEDGDVPGFGIEFEHVHNPTPDALWNLIENANPLAYIPNGAKYE